jgi:hypothetical protein
VCQVLHRKLVEGQLKIVRPRVLEREAQGQASKDAAAAASGEALVGRAMVHLKNGDFEAAMRHLRAASSLEPDNRDLRLVIQQKELEIRGEIADAGVLPDCVPVLISDMKQLRKVNFSPEEGFILSRINGRSDIRLIIKISPLSEIGSLLVFWKLLKEGHLRLDEA